MARDGSKKAISLELIRRTDGPSLTILQTSRCPAGSSAGAAAVPALVACACRSWGLHRGRLAPHLNAAARTGHARFCRFCRLQLPGNRYNSTLGTGRIGSRRYLERTARAAAIVSSARRPNPSRGWPQEPPCYGWGWPPVPGTMCRREGWETLPSGGYFNFRESQRERWTSLLFQNRPSGESRR